MAVIVEKKYAQFIGVKWKEIYSCDTREEAEEYIKEHAPFMGGGESNYRIVEN
ncbi:MAG: hypothetical protein QM613_06625 [Micrococcaceae bacterium]